MLLERFVNIFNRPHEVQRPKEWYEEPDSIENLVRDHRTPSFIPSETRGAKGEVVQKMLMVVPPESVNVMVDEYKLIDGGGWEFFSKDGKSKGLASIVDLDRKMGEKLRLRRDRTIYEVEFGQRFFPRRRPD